MERDLNRELLKLAAFEGDELEAFLPQWLETAERVKIDDETLIYALDTYIPQNWDIKYLGVRKMIGAYLRELNDIVHTPEMKAKGVKILYGILPAIANYYYAAKNAGGEGIFIGFPDLLMVNTLNSFFHGAAPFLNVAEQYGFTYGCRHCPLNKMRLGAYVTGTIAAPDLIWSWGFNCDEGPKTDELIQCLLGEEWTYVISRIPHDTYFGQADDEYSRVKYLSQVIKSDIDKMSELTGIYPTEEDFKQALADAGRYLFKLGMLGNLVCNADPVPLGGNALVLFQDGIGVPLNYGHKYLEEAIDIMLKEVKEAVKNGVGILPKGAPKVGSYFIPWCIPWIDKVFRENGVATTFSQTLTPSKSQMKPSAYADDPYMGMAEQWLKMPLGQNMGYEAESMIEKVKANKPDGMLMGFFDFDRWLGAHQKMCAEIVQKATGVPHYYIEADFWDDREYSEEALRTRIESICQIMHTRKGD